MYVGSIFNIFRIGPGPSSSHSIAPQRAAKVFLERMPPGTKLVRVTLYGSLAATASGHFTDTALKEVLEAVPHEIRLNDTEPNLPHPNTLLFEALNTSGQTVFSWQVFSIGGGSLADAGGVVGDAGQLCYRLHNLSEALSFCHQNGLSFFDLVNSNEDNLLARLEEVWGIMRQSIERGLSSEARLLPGPLGLKRRAKATFSGSASLTSPHKDIALLSAFALAVAEENAAGGVIVTAPTCGSAGVLPGLLYYFEEVKKTPRREILKALGTAGLFGSVIAANASIAGAQVGCQGEIGAACSMAAAGATQLLGGSLKQIEYAAEIAMEHHLGLTCDPVEGYVQVPCIERNMAACLSAFECASFAMLTDGEHLISFDEVIEAMNETGRDLQAAYRETAKGGLALLWKKRRKAAS